MLTIRTIDKIKNGCRITFFNGIYAVIIGILCVFMAKFLAVSSFRKFDVVWQVFEKYNPAISAIFIKMAILIGVLIIALGITIIYLSNYISRKKEKPAWAALFLIGIIFWPAFLTIAVLNKNAYMITAGFIGWLSFIIGMLIPIRYYLQRDYEEY